MSAKEYSSYQKDVISNYYKNIDTIAIQKLQELVTDLYLADTKKKQDQLWQRVEKSLDKLKIKPAIKQHIMTKRSPEILAKNITDWTKK